MKSLNDYIDDKTTNLFNELGIFFAFSKEQILEGLDRQDPQRERGKYTALPGGMFCPSANVSAFIERYDSIIDEGIKADIAENGAYNIICRELDNHEYGYHGDISTTVDALKGYGFTAEQVAAAARGLNWYKKKGYE